MGKRYRDIDDVTSWKANLPVDDSAVYFGAVVHQCPFDITWFFEGNDFSENHKDIFTGESNQSTEIIYKIYLEWNLLYSW